MDCIFCKIINKELPAKILFEDEFLIVFSDINPKAKIHLLLVVKKHIDSLAELTNTDQETVWQLIWRAKEIAKEHGINQSGYKLVSNVGTDGGQTISHLHFHLLGGEPLKGLV